VQLSDGRHSERLYIESYRPQGFRVSGVMHEGSLLLGRAFVAHWNVAAAAEASEANLEPLLAAEPDLRILVLGCGPRLLRPHPRLVDALGRRGVVIEPMDTGAACRTFNLLMSEERSAGAALLAL
jgi:uncharacterized protein